MNLSTLTFYPVKGCAGVALGEAEIAPTGVRALGCADREWMIVDANGRFVSQREQARLARVSVTPSPAGIALCAPGMERIELERSQSSPAAVSVWRDTVQAFDEGERAAGWLSSYLGVPVRLVRFDARLRRECNRECAGDSGAHTFFADGYPLLAIGDASLADLNRRLVAKGAQPLPMNRFRPNLVIDGLEPYDEDHVDRLTIGAAVLRPVKPCIRCVVTTIDQASAQRGTEPLQTLAGYRRTDRLDGVAFGMNAIVEQPGAVRVGDAVQAEFRFY